MEILFANYDFSQAIFWLFNLDMWFSALVVLINLNNFGYRFFELRFICIYWRKNTPYEVFFCRINRGCVFFTFLKTLIRVLTHFTLFVILWGFSLERIKCLKSVETVTDWSLRKTWQFLSIWRSAWLQATNFKTRENTLRPSITYKWLLKNSAVRRGLRVEGGEVICLRYTYLTPNLYAL